MLRKKVLELKKKINKRHIKIVLIIVIIIIFLSVLAKYIEEKRYKEKILDTQYDTFEDFKSPKEYIIYSGNTYIKEEKSKQKDIYVDIYMIFKKELYSNGKSNQYFYERTINLIASTLNYQNFRIIDSDQELVITVYCQDNFVKSIYYNGELNYFQKTDSMNSIKNYQETPITKLNIQSTEINNLIKNNWYFSKIQYGTRISIEQLYEVYEEKGIRIRNIEKKVFNIVFLKNYKQKILNNLTTSSTKDEIISELGEPTFNEYGIIGYKGEKIYVFFGNNFISIYRIDDDKQGYEEFLEIQKAFREDKDVKKLLSKITQLWEDFDKYKVESNFVNIRYSLKGINIKINVDKENGFVFYNNYNGEIEDNLNIINFKNSEKELPKYTYLKATKDLVEEYEIERAILFNDIIL